MRANSCDGKIRFNHFGVEKIMKRVSSERTNASVEILENIILRFSIVASGDGYILCPIIGANCSKIKIRPTPFVKPDITG